MATDDILNAMKSLPIRHQNALLWFAENFDKVDRWPEKLSDGTFVATKAKGIYKPKWTEYALSVKQTLAGPYADIAPSISNSGTWHYKYYPRRKRF